MSISRYDLQDFHINLTHHNARLLYVSQERFAGDVNSYIQIANSPFLECGKVKFFNFQTYAYDAEKESYRKSYNQLMRLWLTEENSISSAVIKRMLKE